MHLYRIHYFINIFILFVINTSMCIIKTYITQYKNNEMCKNCLSMLDNSIWAATWQNQKNECAPSEDSDQPGHPPSLIRVFTVCMKKSWVLNYLLSAERRLWSDWADAQADLHLARTWFCWFCHVVAHLISWIVIQIIKMQESCPFQKCKKKKILWTKWVKSCSCLKRHCHKV